VLRCHDRILSRSEGRSLAGLISEVLPSAKRMLVDLTEVRLLDGGTLGELAMVHMWADAAGLSLLLVGPSDHVLRLIEDANLDSLFDIYADVDSAVAAMNFSGAWPEEMQSA
jgi:anti-anti-sigma regulatory factor